MNEETTQSFDLDAIRWDRVLVIITLVVWKAWLLLALAFFFWRRIDRGTQWSFCGLDWDSHSSGTNHNRTPETFSAPVSVRTFDYVAETEGDGT